MRNLTTLIYLFILMLSCKPAEDRDHLIFKDAIGTVELNMQIVNNILPKIPLQTDSLKIQSYFYKLIKKDTILYINANKIGNPSKASTRRIIDSIFIDKTISSNFLKSSIALARNNLTHCINGYCGWVYVYKFSNDRGAFRPVSYNYPGRKEFMKDSCQLQLIDRKGNILLFKESL